MYVLGVDGGNTKTHAFVATRDGAVVGAGHAGCSDIYGAASEAAALAEADRAIRQALDVAGVRPADLAAGAFSMAGADWPEDYAFLTETMTARGYGERVTVVNDALGALRAGTDGPGIAVVCGTGIATGAQGPDGRRWHTSFWQEPGGSGEFANRVIVAVSRAALGIDPPTSLTPRLLMALGEERVDAALHRIWNRQAPAPNIKAQLTGAALAEAAAGDAAAIAIVTGLGEAMGEYAVAAGRRVGLSANDGFDLVLSGGVFRYPSGALQETIIDQVRAAYPRARPVRPALEPVAGAVLLALALCDVPVTPAVRERLAETTPPDAHLVEARPTGNAGYRAFGD